MEDAWRCASCWATWGSPHGEKTPRDTKPIFGYLHLTARPLGGAIAGDPILHWAAPSLYSLSVFAKTNQNPNFIREEAQFSSEQGNDAYIFLYPVGMVAQDIRKEISHLVYVLKKFNKSAFLIRSDKSDASAILQKMLNHLSSMKELSKFSVKGLEQLLSSQEHFST